MKQIDLARYNKGQTSHKMILECGEIYEDFSDENTTCDLVESDKIGTYNLIFNSYYGWREMFDKDPDYQKDFDKWMRDKKYGYKENGFWYIKELNDDYYFRTLPEGLTGFIFKFMQERMK